MKRRAFFWGLTIIIIASLLLFGFWSHPLADDYILSYHLKQSGFWGLQKWIYNNNTGRYTSSFLGAAFAYKGFLYNYYFVPLIVLLCASLWSFYWISTCISKITNCTSRKNVGVISIVAWLTYIIILPEKSTAFYWFSAAITYTTGTILFILYLSNWITLLSNNVHGIKRALNQATTPILLFLIIGTNELMALITMLGTIMLFAFLRPDLRSKHKITIVTTCLTGTTGLLLLFLSPGIHQRVNGDLFSNLIPAGLSTAIWLAVSVWYIMKLPIIWFILILLYFAGLNTKTGEYPSNLNILFPTLSQKRLIFICLMIAIIPLFLVLTGSHGSFPMRMLNVECLTIMGCLSILTYYMGYKSQAKNHFAYLQNIVIKKYFWELICIFVLISPLPYQIFQTFLSGYNYNLAFENQNEALRSATSNTVVLPSDIKTSRKQIIKNNNSFIYGRAIFREIGLQNPQLIYFEPIKQEKSFQYKMTFYDLDSVKFGEDWYVNTLKK